MSYEESNKTDQDKDDLIRQRCYFFDKEFEEFVELSKSIILRASDDDNSLADQKEHTKKLNNYYKIYKKTNSRDHFNYFEMFYNRNRNDVLNIMNSDEWIKNGNKSYIQFADNNAKLTNDDLKFRIDIASIYKDALLIKKHAESNKIINGEFSPAEKRDYFKNKNFQLRLLRLIYYALETRDKKEVAKIIQNLEIELGVPERNKTILEKDDTSNGSNSEDFVQGMFKRFTGIMKDVGLNVPNNETPGLNQTDILGMIDGFMENDSFKSVLTAASGSLKNIGPDFQNNLMNMVFKDGKFNQDIIQTLISTVSTGDISKIKTLASTLGINLDGIEDMNQIQDMIREKIPNFPDFKNPFSSNGDDYDDDDYDDDDYEDDE